MKLHLLSLVLAATCIHCGTPPSESTSVLNGRPERFPTTPDPNLTPGTLCDHPDRYRYRARIAYCERDVSSSLKREIIQEYDEELGYSIGSMKRSDFKIDHYIPLSIGGSNEPENLWPQHKSIYVLTDPVEHLVFELLSGDDITQQEAVDIVRTAKANPQEAPELVESLKARYGRH